MDIKIYNTLTKQKEIFKPINKEEVRIYSCGPTVYNYAHIGNMRAYISMDMLRSVLKYNGYKLKHAMNITDVGHLTSDADEGEDKMAKAAREQKKSPYEIADMYTKIFLDDIEKLNIERPEIICKATEHIEEMKAYVEKIIENGYGYETSKGIYFDVSKLKTYGELSGVDLEGQLSGARIVVDEEKRSPLDFALWIKAPENHIMKWDSPWGKSYPGWHIECSAMSKKYLGEVFDIHTGGVDHIPIHHENEIAQSRGACGKNLANYWMHTEFLLIDSGKMSKSLGNTYTIEDLKARGISALAYRYFTYTAHYRNKLNFTWDGIKASEVSLQRLRENYRQHKASKLEISEDIIEGFRKDFLEAINDDFNMPSAMATVWNIAKYNVKSYKLANLLLELDEVIKLNIAEEIKETKLSEELQEILEERKQSRENKDFKKSDELRDLLKTKGYIVKDTKDGQELTSI
ncbi:MAG: cysteine--tRNA ligase [Clostridia bacterium]